MTFYQKLEVAVAKNNSLVCIGLDSDIEKIPQRLRSDTTPQFTFNKAIIDATHDFVCAYKPNSAFYEARGDRGIAELKMTCDYIRENYPELVLILDAKRADIGSTNKGYVRYVFDWLEADAITLHPYLGKDAILPFLERKDKGCIVLCRTSNAGAAEIQDIETTTLDSGNQYNKVYQVVAQKVATEWNTNGNCGLVVGATYPDELQIVRRIVGDMPILVPGIGAQGGNLKQTLGTGLSNAMSSLLINSSRAIIFANDPGSQARLLRDAINTYRS